MPLGGGPAQEVVQVNARIFRVASRIRPAATVAVVATALVVAQAARAGPPNDAFDQPQRLPMVPVSIEGTLAGAHLDEAEPAPWTTAVKSVVWYSVRAPRRGPMVARLHAGGTLDAAIAVF